MILHGDCIEQMKTLADNSVDAVVTSPPYWGLRDYGVDGQLGLEDTPEIYIEKMVSVFNEVKRVLKDNGTLWLNLGDTYAQSNYGDKRTDFSKSPKQATNKGAINFSAKLSAKLSAKQLVGIPWRTALAIRDAGWILRQDIIWHKPNVMPESITDRCTKSHEYIFLFSKSQNYFFDHIAIKEPAVDKRGPGNTKQPRQVPGHAKGTLRHNLHKIEVKETRNKRSVWTVTNKPLKDAHFATFPPDLIEPCVLAGCPDGGIVLDPFFGSGTVGVVAQKLNRKFIGIELNPEYLEIAKRRIEHAEKENGTG